MTARTWRQAQTLLAAVDEPLSREAVAVALAAAAYRWGVVGGGYAATLLTGAEDLDTARDLARQPGTVVADVREVDGLPDAGWALAWTFEQGANT